MLPSNDIFNHLPFCSPRARDGPDSLFEFFIRRRKHADKVVPPGTEVVFSFVPFLGAFIKRFVISFFAFLYDSFEADDVKSVVNSKIVSRFPQLLTAAVYLVIHPA